MIEIVLYHHVRGPAEVRSSANRLQGAGHVHPPLALPDTVQAEAT